MENKNILLNKHGYHLIIAETKNSTDIFIGDEYGNRIDITNIIDNLCKPQF